MPLFDSVYSIIGRIKHRTPEKAAQILSYFRTLLQGENYVFRYVFIAKSIHIPRCYLKKINRVTINTRLHEQEGDNKEICICVAMDENDKYYFIEEIGSNSSRIVNSFRIVDDLEESEKKEAIKASENNPR